MKLNHSITVGIALRTLDAQEKEEICGWLDKFANWETDELVRARSYRLTPEGNRYVLHTYTDFRIFFTHQEDAITVIEITTREAILYYGRVRSSSDLDQRRSEGKTAAGKFSR